GDSVATKIRRAVRRMATQYDLIDLETGVIAGQITDDGEVTSDRPDIIQRVTAAYQRELLVRDGDVLDELGVCFEGVETIAPGHPDHRRLVLTHLGQLAGVLPQPR
ncbi:MAG TPA: hypothetical protein VFL82_14450, partial [Thermomicrobiales bacterium]|nr:hypothetical protein [Thermomicrobiales bacterium]